MGGLLGNGSQARPFTEQDIAAAGDTRYLSGNVAQSLSPSQKSQSLSNQKISAATIQNFTSGSGTYTTPANVKWIEVYMVGGGGGGAGCSVTASVAGSSGVKSTFNGVDAAPGGGGPASAGVGVSSNGGTGGTGGSGVATRRMPGNGGQYGSLISATLAGPAGQGGGSVLFGGGGVSAAPGSNSSGSGAGVNSGGGGGGSYANGTNYVPGSGGGSGESVYLLIDSPAATYSYAVGAAGSGGSSTQNGGNGSAGYIMVVEHYGLP